MTAIRVVIADDQTTVREGLVALLSLLPDIEVVAQATDGHAAMAEAAAHHPDVVLLDLRMPGMDGITATRQLVANHPGIAVIILTGYADDASILDALAAGARGYLTKNSSRTEIHHAVTAAAAGLATLEPSIHHRVVSAARVGRTPAEMPDRLTPREAEVLALLASGLANLQIARRLHIEPATVKSHINHIFTKIGATDRAAATKYAHQRGLVA